MDDEPDDTDLDDTVAAVPRAPRPDPRLMDEDTLLRERKPVPAQGEKESAPHPVEAVAPVELVDPSRPVAPASAPRLIEPPAPPPRELPEAYSFRINNHVPIPLDVPAYIGRRPASPRIPGRIAPRLVRVPSPQNEVSGTHLEVRQHGTSVLITDLKSTNGTVVRMPGSAPLKLHQGESLVVLPGTLVDIGDGNVLEILPIRRFVAPFGAPGERLGQ